MGLQGTLDTMDAEELVSWLMAKPRTGLLRFRRAGVNKTVSIEAGRAINAASTDPREYLGQLLIGFGWVSEEQLQAAFDSQRETRALVGRILVDQGLLNEEQVLSALRMKVSETFLDLFLWPQGIFNFEPETSSAWESVVPVSIGLEDLLKEGLIRRRLKDEIRKLIPDDRCRFSCRDEVIPAGLEPRTYEGSMVAYVRQGLPVADLVLRFHKLEFSVLKTLYDMVKRGWLEVVPGLGEGERDGGIVAAPASAKDYLHSARLALQQRAFDQALKILGQALADYPFDLSLCEMYDTVERRLAGALKKELLGGSRVPHALRGPETADLHTMSPAERYLLSRVDGKRSLRSIVMISPIKEVEALRAFQALIRSGLVGLKG